MRRLRLGAITAFTLSAAAAAAPAWAAEVTRVATRGEPGNPFELHLSVFYDRLQERAQITRERIVGGGPGDPGRIADGDELRYSRTVNSIVARAAVALAEDLDLHFEMPYVLADDRSWRFGIHGSSPTGGVPGIVSSIEANPIDVNGQDCGGPCGGVGLFPVAPSTTVYHGGKTGDLKAGLAWGIFSDKKDPTKPFWLVGLDVTVPTAALYDPAANRGSDWSSPFNVQGKPGPFGEKVWKWDFQTILSKRVGVIDPYVKAHAMLMTKSSSTYSNCDHAAELVIPGAGGRAPQMNGAADANCRAGGADTEAKLPWIAGVTFGMEFVPYESTADQQKVSIDLRLWGDYVSAARFYNELTDASGKLNWTDEYLTVGGFLGLYLRASKYVSLHATASLATKTDHFITGETLGRNRTWPDPSQIGANGITTDPSQMNPNFDWRYDAPGRRFKLSEVALFQIQFGGVLQF
ncbi:MAG TPA: hypothetical protein VIV57_15930 [Anaeromyxobacter sp.]